MLRNEAMTSGQVVVLIVAFIFAGSLLTLASKLSYQTIAMGTTAVHTFDHPLFMTFGMFIGETVCFVFYWLFVHKCVSHLAMRTHHRVPLITVPLDRSPHTFLCAEPSHPPPGQR